jgi:hypothetical protein
MEHGDLSNLMPPRILVIANDLLLHWPEHSWSIGGRGFGKWKRMADRTEIDAEARVYLHDLTWRKQYRVDVVIIGVPESFAERMQERFNRINLAIANVYAMPGVRSVVDTLAYMPEVQFIVHGRDDWTYAFGSKAVKGFRDLHA